VRNPEFGAGVAFIAGGEWWDGEVRLPRDSLNDSLCIIACYADRVTISLRNLPPEVEKAIRDTSRREGISLNRATIRLLETALRKPAKNTDFDEFCGVWSKAEADRFDAALIHMRQIDAADWDLPD
jgi:hypothetical protein